MKTIFRVAKTELRTLFYSPIAWFLIIVFFIQCALLYMGMIKGIARVQELGGEEIRFLDKLTIGIFVGFGGMFNNVISDALPVHTVAHHEPYQSRNRQRHHQTLVFIAC
jgi:ABC-2 type transport system permease protein